VTTASNIFRAPRPYEDLTLDPSLIGPSQWLLADWAGVEVMAEVRLNGKDLGVLGSLPIGWISPVRPRPRQHARNQGRQSLDQRQIGDEFLPEDSERNTRNPEKNGRPGWPTERVSPTGRKSFTSWRLWHKKDAPVASGLLGPVQVISHVAPDLQPLKRRSGGQRE